MTGEPRGFFRVAVGFSNYNGEFMLPLVLSQGCSVLGGLKTTALLALKAASFQRVSLCRALRPHLHKAAASTPLGGRVSTAQVLQALHDPQRVESPTEC